MHDIWKKKQRVTYSDFSEFVRKYHPLETTLHIPKHTFSRLLHEFLQDKCIMKCNNSELYNIITESIFKAIQDGIHERNELQNHVKEILKDRKIYFPSALVLDRMIGNITSDAMFNHDTENINLISKIIGKDITSLKFVKEFEINNQYITFPPMYEGKLGVKKLTSEYNISVQIKEKIQKEGIEFEQIMQLPDIHFSKELIEKLHPSEVIRSSKRAYAIHLLKYYAARYQDSIDAIVKCFIKSTRLMQFRANKSYDEKSGKDSRSFLQHNNTQFQDILDAMKSGNISVLEDYQDFFEMVAKKTGYYHNKEGYFAALASRCTYSRILSQKIVFLEFIGLDESSNILVETLKEIFESKELKKM